MADVAQEDGAYPRLNAAMLTSGQYGGLIVSVVGCVQSFDGETIQLKCADGGIVCVTTDAADFAQPTGAMVELIGAVQPDHTLSLFVTRELGNDLELDLYNRMITEVQQNPRFKECFSS